MRYTHHRGLAAVTRWVRLKFAAMNLKKQGNWNWKGFFFRFISVHCFLNYMRTPLLSANESRGFLGQAESGQACLSGFFMRFSFYP